jgi:hypothetical protein
MIRRRWWPRPVVPSAARSPRCRRHHARPVPLLSLPPACGSPRDPLLVRCRPVPARFPVRDLPPPPIRHPIFPPLRSGRGVRRRRGVERAATGPRIVRGSHDDVLTAARASLSAELIVTARRGGLAESSVPRTLGDRPAAACGWAVVAARQGEGDGEGIGRMRRRRAQLRIGAVCCANNCGRGWHRRRESDLSLGLVPVDAAGSRTSVSIFLF